MRRSAAWALGGGVVAAAAYAVRRLRGGKERVDLVYDDGSTVSLPDTHVEAQRLLPFGRDILHLARDR